MGMIDKFLDVMRLNPEDDEDDFYEDDFYEDDEPEVTKRSSRKERKSAEYDESPSKKDKSKTAPKITPMRSVKKQGIGGMEVCVIKPNTIEDEREIVTSVEDAREITETLLSNRTVILNVEGLDIEIAQRIIDFTSGSCFAISGNLQKISNYIFIITPASVDISGDFQNLLDSFSTSGLHTDL